MLSDQQQYRYMTVDDMKSMGDDSMRVNVTDDERDNRHSGGKFVINKSNVYYVFLNIFVIFSRELIFSYNYSMIQI